MKTFTIGQFLTDADIAKAKALYRSRGQNGKSFAQTVADEIIRPNIDRINKALGQENDPLYLAYAVEYAMMRAS